MTTKARPALVPALVADVMQRDVLEVRFDASLRELARLLWRERVSGVPVVDAEGKLVGMVSASDLLWILDRFLLPPEEAVRRGETFSREALEERTVGEVMTPDVFGVAPTTTLPQLCEFLRRHGVHRALVLEDGELAGVVSVSDLLGVLAGEVGDGWREG